jgi:hypothetical protein
VQISRSLFIAVVAGLVFSEASVSWACEKCGLKGDAAGAAGTESWDAPFCTRPPSFLGSVTMDFVALDRSSVDDQDTLFANDFSNPVMNNRELSFGVEGGFRLDLVIPSACGCDLNFNYLGLGDSQDSITRDDAGVFWLFYGFVPATPASSYTVEYLSNLESFEVNLRTREWPRVAALAGFRVAELEEEFNIWQTGTTTGVVSGTENEMYGVQFGLQGLLLQWHRWTVETTAKAGVFYNDIGIRAEAADASGTRILDGHFQQIAFLGEVQLMVAFQVSPWLRLRTGYQALWLEGIALAPDQSDSSSFSTNLVTVDIGSAVYQGGFVGTEITW